MMGYMGPSAAPSGYTGAYAMPVPAPEGAYSFPYPHVTKSKEQEPKEGPDMSKYVLRSEEDNRFDVLESRVKVDEEQMKTMRKTIKLLQERLDSNGKR
ncbi:hypothetical protein GUITHDRAFT_121567 [Guillardia theta CCMP2712]|uniref:Uncharacterized protein n=1 Tax=Guillardia theta (strain CCMP2712) TaxID=905079 RepID=L1I8X5_GUITC|nr:hypothetical protein GUITHDRAFT_121567 [Guillardia theta CCMP2712]EKX32275.1 hypothetical protein GUITHDRAFT_121567 [Guillardia theta CCMP2712]|eukprot:XP_005819255.1 hypothetical protein GUITHDRAFT_121567 [Guillardia theta CCMP2712]